MDKATVKIFAGKEAAMRTRISLLLLLAGLLACAPEPQKFEARMGTARTPPMVVADWIIQGRIDFFVIDLRQAEAFRKGHLPGAINLTPEELARPGTLRQLPDYKKLVFYGAEDQQARVLTPMFARGLHVLTLEGGYEGWQREVMTRPANLTSADGPKREAVSKYFRGESALGTPQMLKEVPAQQYIRPPGLPAGDGTRPKKLEGC
jgi:rhodanese-related sulfurtransferase